MKKSAIFFLSTLISANLIFAQKAKKTSFDFKQEILPIKLIPTDIKTFDYAIISNEADKKELAEMGNKINKVFGVKPTSPSTRLFKRIHFDQLKNSFTALKYKDNKSFLGVMGTASGSGTLQSYQNVDKYTDEADISITIEFGNYDLPNKELKDNTYNLQLSFPSAKFSINNNKTKEKIEDLFVFKNLLVYNFPLNYNQGSATPLSFPNKLALDNGLSNALSADLDEKIRQYLFDALIKEVVNHINYNYNFNVVNTTFYFAYPKNEKLIEYKNSVMEMEKVTELITKNSKSLKHLNWNLKEIQDKTKDFIVKMETALKLYDEKGKELEMSEEIAEGFKLNLVSAYCLTNDFEKAAKLYEQLKSAKSSYANEAQEIINSVNKANINIDVYKKLFGWGEL